MTTKIKTAELHTEQ